MKWTCWLLIAFQPSSRRHRPAFTRGRLFKYDLVARDVDLDPVQYSIVSGAPAGMVIDSLGRIRWATTPANTGSYMIQVRATDPRGGVANQAINLQVVADDVAPKVTVLPTPGGWPWDGPIVVFVSAVDNVGVTNVELKVNDRVVALDANRTARLSADDWGFGTLNMVATARDAAGNVGSGTGVSGYRNPDVDYEANPAVPTAIVTSPAVDASVVGMARIEGTAGGPDFKEYRLSYARADQLSFTEFAHSSTTVTEGLLGTWDTTLLENDAYIIRLEVTDVIGSTSVVDVPVGLSGALKLGNFRLSFEDMTVPVAGIPITIVRTYDTLRADRDSDFGYGWRMEFRNTDLRTSLPKSGLEDIGIYTPFKQGTKVYLTLPGGERQGFTFTPEIRVLPGFGRGNDLVIAFPRFTSDRGITSTLSAGGGSLLVNEFGEMYTAGGIPWNPASPEFSGYTLTTADRTQYRIDGSRGLLTSAMDRNGNLVEFSESSIHAKNVEVKFERDNSGRVAKIVDPSGHATTYRYSATGDLIESVDRENNKTTYEYRLDHPHYLSQINDSLGQNASRIDYDPDGRMSSVVAGGKQSTSLDYLLDQSRVASTDSAGNVTLRSYDEDGNITSITDPLGRTTRWEFDSLGQITLAVSPDGARTQISRDNLGRETSRTSPLGATTAYTYGAAGKLTSVTDPLGNTWNFVLDSRGNRLVEKDPLNNTMTREFSESGLLTSIVDADGYERRYVYDNKGQLQSFVDPNSVTHTLTYDLQGNLISASDAGSGSDVVTAQYTYDRNGQLLISTDPLGKQSTSAYLPTGEIATTTDATGRSMHFQYDSTGQRTSVGFNDGTSITYAYNEQGSFAQQTMPGGTQYRNQIDAAGQVRSIILPDLTPLNDDDNLRSELTYDLNGRVVSKTSSASRQTDFSFDLDGRSVGASDSSGDTSVQFDAADRMIARTDILGNLTKYEYDAAGRPVAFEDSSGRTTMSYDRRGNLTFIMDPLGRQTRYEYDSLSRKTAVIEPDGDRYEYEYNFMNLITAMRNPLERVTRYEYDKAGRNTAIVTPSGLRRDMEYDAAGRMLKTTNGEDESVEFAYDEQGRLKKKSYSDGTNVQIEYGTDGQVSKWIEGNETLEFKYDGLGRLIERIQSASERIHYNHDAVGRLTKITSPSGSNAFQLDALGRITSNVDSHAGEFKYQYDSHDRLVRKDLPNGVVELTSYNPEGRVSRLEIRNVANQLIDQIDYSYDSLGRMTKMARISGDTQWFEYDLQDRLASETLQHANGDQSKTSYTYDRVGNRIQIQDASGITSYDYDADDRLLRVATPSGTTVYTYDRAGRRKTENDGVASREYHWGKEDRLVETRVTSVSSSTNIQYGYDPAGNRISETNNGVVTRLLIDEAAYGRSNVLEQSTNGQRSRFAFGINREAIVDSNGTTYISADIRNTPVAFTNQAGQTLQWPNYSGFGVPLQAAVGGSPNSALPGYTGEALDEQLGLVNLRARQYDPRSGQFLSADPFPATKELTGTIGRYAYAHNSPTLATDPTGLSTLIELSTTMKIISTLAVTTGAIGSLVQSEFGSTQWDGWTALVNQSSSTITVGLGLGGTLLHHPGYNQRTSQATTTTAMHLIAFETVSAAVPLDRAISYVASNHPVLSALGLLGFVPMAPMATVSLATSYSPIDISVASTTMFAPKLSEGSGSAFFGPYLSIGGGVSGGVGFAPIATMIHSAISNKVDATTLSTTLGYSGAIQGFAYGYSKLNTGYTLKASLGLQIIAGLSIGWSTESAATPSTNS